MSRERGRGGGTGSKGLVSTWREPLLAVHNANSYRVAQRDHGHLSRIEHVTS